MTFLAEAKMHAGHNAWLPYLSFTGTRFNNCRLIIDNFGPNPGTVAALNLI